jgi:hypothetical protein
MKKYLLLFIGIAVFNCEAQVPSALFNEISSADVKFFDAFNSCNIKKMGNMFSKDLEFYHDLGGVSGYEGTMEVSKANCNKKLGLVRKIVKDSMSVYPIKDFGAIQKGRHTFCHIENGKNDCGTFEFVHIWKKINGSWQITRVISYGH